MVGAENTAAMVGVHKYPDAGAYCLAVALRVMFTELQIDLMSMETQSINPEEAEPEAALAWYCSSCVQQMISEGVSFCDSCLRVMEE